MYVANGGQEVASATCWTTRHARGGYLYLGFNAGVLRLVALQPAAAAAACGTPCKYLQGCLPEEPGMQALVWHDSPSPPYRAAVSQHQVDGSLPEDDDGKEIRLPWYVPDRERGPEAAREVRRERVRVVVRG